MLRSFLVLFICVLGSSVAFENFWLGDPGLRPIQSECGPNQIYECVNPCPLIQTCEDRALNITCSTNQVCDYLCVCKEGYFRRFEGGDCIPEEECGPVLRCTEDERYTHCKPSCSNDSCSSIASLPNCDNEEIKPCVPGCTCRDGYYRKEEGSPCIPLCLCPEAQDSHDCSDWLTHFRQAPSRKIVPLTGF